MKKRVVALMMASAMALSCAACGSSNTSTSSSAAAGDTQAAEGEAELDLDDIYECYVTWPSLSGAPADIEMVEDAINEITEPQIGVHVTLQPVGISDLTSQQQLLISSGEKEDIIVMLWSGLDTWVNTESVLELEDLLPTYGSGIVENLGDLAYGCSKNGHVYGITGAPGGASTGFLANSNILEECGIDTTDRQITIEELEEIFATVKAAKGDGFYCVSGGGGFGIVGEAYDSLGSNEYNGVIMLDGDTTQVVDMYESDAYMEYAERMYDWAQKGYISPDAATTEDSVQTQLATQNYLGAFSYTDQEGVKTSYNSSGAFPITALTIQDAVTRTSDMTDIMFGIASTCENPEKAMAFLNLLYTDSDLDSILANGIEGTHYQVVEENDAGQKLITFADGVDMTTSGYYVALNVWALNPNTSWSSFEALDETATRRSYPTSPAFGYAFDSTDVSTEATALSAVYNEYNTIINCGAVDPATEVPAFIQALKDAGVEKVIEANQEQYTEWQNAQ